MVFCLVVWFGFFFFRDRVSLYSLELYRVSPGTHSVDQAGLELRNLPASASASQSAGITGVRHHRPAGLWCFKSAWSEVPGQPELHSDILSQKQ